MATREKLAFCDVLLKYVDALLCKRFYDIEV